MSAAAEVRHVFGGGHSATEAVNVILDKSGLPQALKERLLHDALGGGDTYQRIPSTEHLEMMAPNSSWIGTVCSGCTCRNSTLIIAGRVGKMRENDDFFFLAPGYHSYASCGQEMLGDEDVSVVNKAVVNGPRGFVTVSEGRCGVLMVGAEFKLLPPGTYQWNSPSVVFVQAVDITRNDARLGPYSLITVPDGDVAVTFNNGNLVILGHDTQPNSPQAPASRTYFLDDPKWVLCCFLSLKEQTDRLEGNDLLSKDNVELLMVAWSHWRIVDPVLAVSRCATTMDDIRTKVDALVRAAIARIVAGTNIGSGPVSGGLSRPLMVARDVKGDGGDEPNLSHLMQSDQATRHMSELSAHLSVMGVEVVGVYVPEKRMKNDDIRQEVAKQAVIGIKAEAERSAADAQAYATVTAAKAQAEAIAELARAHADAGARLGEATGTAARLALTEAMTKTFEKSNVTIFSGGPSQMSYLLSGPTA